MRLVPIPLTQEALRDSWPLWGPFMPSISKRTKMSMLSLVRQVRLYEVWLTLIWDDKTNKPAALLGTRFHMRERPNQTGADKVAEIIWATGRNYKAWIHLLPEFEQLLMRAGAVECRPICRPGWMKALQAYGYKVTHLQMEKTLHGQFITAASHPDAEQRAVGAVAGLPAQRVDRRQ